MRTEKSPSMALALVFSILALHSSANSCEPYNPYKYTGPETLEVFTFPLLPGTSEWNQASEKFRDGEGPNPRESFTVSDTVLMNYSTKALLWTALRYPRRQPWGTYSLAHPTFIGLESNFFQRFSGAEIARGRDDFASALVELYRQHEPNDLWDCPFISNLHGSYFQEDLGLLEILLSNYEVLDRLDPREKEDLLHLVLERFSARKDQVAGNGTSAALAGRILLSLDNPEFRRECDRDDALEVFLDMPHVDITSHYPYAELVMESGRRWLDKRGRADE